MKCNVGKRESKMRVAGGIITGLLSFVAPLPRSIKIALRAMSLGQLSSGITRFCPTNQLFGINNCRREEGKRFFELLS